MINYLKGKAVEVVRSTTNRVMLILEVNQIGYEVQIPSRLARQLATGESELQIFTHLQVREDQQILYGFASAAERDLFRQLISVSGIGTQLAIALIDTLGLTDLVQAIVTTNLRALGKTPGVGKKNRRTNFSRIENQASSMAAGFRCRCLGFRNSGGCRVRRCGNDSPRPRLHQ